MSDSAGNFFNDGVMTFNARHTEAARTFVVTGVARSGTSMVAQALAKSGIFMGTGLDDVVFEDVAIADALTSANLEALTGIIETRNQQHPIWGFKRPHLFNNAGPELEARLRNPHFILTYRDPVAIAKRNRISEYFEEKSALRDAANDLNRCVAFALDLTCPTLLISYEKALQQPAALVANLVAFCGLTATPAQRRRMAATIEANPPAYARTSRRQFEGYVDVMRNGVVAGWCRQIGENAPVLLEVRIGDATQLPVMADGFRSDLAEAGFGTGCHAFTLDISPYSPSSSETISVRVHDRLFELTGSGQTVAQLSR